MTANRLRRLVGFAELLTLVWLAPRLLAIERWVFCPVNLLVNQNVTNLVSLMQRASTAGYTHILLGDTKFSFLGQMGPPYFANVTKVKTAALKYGLEIVPGVFPIGYSNDILFNDPNLVEGLPVTNALLVVQNGVAKIQADPIVSFAAAGFTNLNAWTWKDTTVVEDSGSARVTDPNGANARIVQTLKVKPFRQYHISVKIKTTNCLTQPNLEVLAGNQTLNYTDLGVQSTQGWTTHHVVFNSLANTSVGVYFGVWGGSTGTLWWNSPAIEEVAFLNLIRRSGAPLTVQIEGGTNLVEGKDFSALSDPLMGTQPYNGTYDVYHSAPLLKTSLPNGTRLRASWYHAVIIEDGQAMICPSEPKTLALLQDQAQRVHAAFGARGYFMGHDEIRVMNWCAACQARHLDAGAMLADNVQACAAILRSVNPGGRIYVWSDMFDPNHNAHNNYYLVRGDLTGSWKGLDKDIIITDWNYGARAASMQWFAGLGNRQMIAGYYDSDPSLVTNWLAAGSLYPGITAVMYTTWVGNYANIGPFNQFISGYPAPSLWLQPRLNTYFNAGRYIFDLEGERGRKYVVENSPNLATWQTWTNFTAADATVTFDSVPQEPQSSPQFFRATVSP